MSRTSSAPFDRVEFVLLTARQKLLATDMPFMLRAVGFLRLSCCVLNKKGAYPQLLRTLSEQDQEWWNTCEVTSIGTLRSSNPQINRLLEPVLQLHQKHESPLAA